MVVSPANVKQNCPAVLAVVLALGLVELPYPAPLADLRSIQGTGTNFPALERLELLGVVVVVDV